MPRDSVNNDIEESNATVNYLLGGRSKSWMTSAPRPDPTTPQSGSPPRRRSLQHRNLGNSRSTNPQPPSSGRDGHAVVSDPVSRAAAASPRMETHEADEAMAQAPPSAGGDQLLTPAGSGSVSPRNNAGGPSSERDKQLPRREAVAASQATPSTIVPAGPAPHPTAAANAAPQPTTDFFDPQRCSELIALFQLSENAKDLAPKLSNLEIARLELLRKVSQDRDITFLLVHQLCCIDFSTPDRLPESLRGRSEVAATFKLLDDITRLRSKLSHRVVKFCADFPAPLPEMLRVTPQVYESRVDELDLFLRKAAASLSDVKERIIVRQYPPMASELSEWMGASSLTLQKLISFPLLRILWDTPDSPWFKIALHLSDLNIVDWQRVEAREPKHPFDEGALESYHNWFICRYQALNKLRLESRRTGNNHIEIPAGSPLRDLKHSPVELLLEKWRQPARPSSSSVHGKALQPGGATNVQPGSVQQQPLGTFGGDPRPAPPATGPTAAPSPSNGHRRPARRSSSHQSVQDLSSATQFQASSLDPLISLQGLGVGQTPDQVYQYVPGFEVPPCAFDHSTYFRMEQMFNIKDHIFGRVAKQGYNQHLRRDVRELRPDTVQYRVRSCAIRDLDGSTANTDKWFVSETLWHPHVYFKLNGHQLETRRVVLHGKHLPVDVTDLVRPGRNSLEIFANVLEDDTTPYEYAFALEIVLIASLASIKDYCLGRVVPAADALASIQAQLSNTQSMASTGTSQARTVSDAVEMTSMALSIPLVAMSNNAGIFDIPVRGSGCRHRQCFDLESFLRTRPVYYTPPSPPPFSNNRRPSELPQAGTGVGVPGSNPQGDVLSRLQTPEGPSAVDCWRCPICKGNASPKHLVVDGFLAEVRKDLERRGLLNTREIVVNSDGIWHPK